MQTRKICLHPYLYPDMWPTKETEDDSDEEYLFDERGINNCGKLKVLDMLLQKLLKEKHKCLLFSQFVMFLDVFEEYCQYRGFTYCRLDGSTSLE